MAQLAGSRDGCDLVDDPVRRKQGVAFSAHVSSPVEQCKKMGKLELEWFTGIANHRDVDDGLLAIAGVLVEACTLDVPIHRDHLSQQIHIDHTAELADSQVPNLLLS